MKHGYFSSAAYALLYLRATQLDPELVLAGTGVSLAEVEQMDFLPSETLARLLRNIDAAGAQPGWAARVGEQLNISSHGPLGFAALSAPTLRAALDVMMDYHAVRVTSISAEVIERDRHTLFVIHDLAGDAQYAQWLAETVLKVMESLVETIMGHPIGEQVTISFTAPAPPYQASLAQTYGSPCQFNAEFNAIAIPTSWGDIRSPLYDEDIYRINIAKCREIISSHTGQVDTLQRVRELLDLHFQQATASAAAGPPPSLEGIADIMHVTPRTLIRRLRSRDTSFRGVIEEAREQCAEELLSRANLTVADVGYRLGYSDSANFGRAFRRWKGLTPAAWRRAQ